MVSPCGRVIWIPPLVAGLWNPFQGVIVDERMNGALGWRKVVTRMPGGRWQPFRRHRFDEWRRYPLTEPDIDS